MVLGITSCGECPRRGSYALALLMRARHAFSSRNAAPQYSTSGLHGRRRRQDFSEQRENTTVAWV